MKVGSTDEFLLLFHFVPVLFTTITFFPWHYKTFCQISRSRVSSINYRPKMTFDDAGAKADQEFDLMKDPGVQSQDRHLLFCPPSLPPLPNKFRWGHRAGGQVYGGQQGGQDQRRVRGESGARGPTYGWQVEDVHIRNNQKYWASYTKYKNVFAVGDGEFVFCQNLTYL